MPERTAYDPDWYRQHAWRYAEVATNFIQSIYHGASHPALRDDSDVLARTQALVPAPARGFDAGCGAGARDVATLASLGYEMRGIDAIEENVAVAHEMHPDLADRVAVHDLHEPLPFDDAAFDFAMCNSVIQHLEPDAIYGVVLPELCRIIRPGGALQLHFKQGEGVWTVLDEAYGAERSFQLYDEDRVLAALEASGMTLVPATDDTLGGIVYGHDSKESPDCFMWLTKGSLSAPS